jgi:cysteine desulfurase
MTVGGDRPIYLDYNATTPIDPAVREAMLPCLGEQFGNPSSGHRYGKEAHRAIDKARRQVADLIGAHAGEVLFTSGGTEASNHAIKGAVLAHHPDRAHVIISAIEHPATVEPCEFLKRFFGCEVTVVPVDRFGLVDPDDVRRALTPRTCLVSIMHSNNEIGTFEPIREIAAIARGQGALMHTDVAQSLGKVEVNADDLGVDLLTIAGHKLYAPKGVGALYVHRGARLARFMDGAGQEDGQRAGTENVPYIVALGKAAELAEQSLPEATMRLRALRDRLEGRLQQAFGERITVNGHPERRLPNTCNVSFLGRIGSEVLDAVPEIAASTGSACHAGKVTESPVLAAMGVGSDIARGAVRLSVGRFTSEEEIDRAVEILVRALK